MGTIHEALYCPEGGFERRVAVKRIHPQLAEQEWFVAGFRAEAEISSRLAHPNIVQVMDFGRVGDTYFLAMEYVDGMPLSTLMRRAFLARLPLPPQIVGAIGRDLLGGLAHAHESARGRDGKPLRVVHRDMCPQNVLLSRHGEVKIADFGVARVLEDAAASHTRNVVGHSAYMAPEQAQGHPIDTRADLFPVGVILWELLAGRRLFHRGLDSATLLALLYEEIVPPTVMRADIDARWDDLVLGALARDPDRRWASAREMLSALESIPDARSEQAANDLAGMVDLLASASDAGEVSASNLDPTSVDLPQGPRERGEATR
jgi:serine/threonine-protein kinase